MIEFGKDVGRKFHADGTPRRFPGNTIIALLDPSGEAFARVGEERDRLGRICGPVMTLLPDVSLHMTVIEGVCDQVRDAAHWTSLLPTDAELEAVDDLFAKEFPSLPPLGRVVMRFDHLRLGGGANIALRPASDGDERRIRSWRDRASEVLGLRFPGHASYVFHIGLGYGITRPDSETERALMDECGRFDRECAEHPFSFVVPEPSLVFFDSMMYFSKDRIPRT